MARVIDIDLDAINQLHPLFGGLDLLGRELGVRGNERDVSVVDLVVERVGGHLDLVAELDASEVLFPNVSAQPGVLDIAHGDDAGTGGQYLTHIGGFHQHHAVDRRDGNGIGQLGVDQAAAYWPLSSLVKVRTAPVSSLVMEIFAPGITAPEGSVMRPANEPVVCAWPAVEAGAAAAPC